MNYYNYCYFYHYRIPKTTKFIKNVLLFLIIVSSIVILFIYNHIISHQFILHNNHIQSSSSSSLLFFSTVQHKLEDHEQQQQQQQQQQHSLRMNNHHQTIRDIIINSNIVNQDKTNTELVKVISKNENLVTVHKNQTETISIKLTTLIDFTNNTIIGNVSYLLDFAIIGFGKCGTTTIMNYLRNSHYHIHQQNQQISQQQQQQSTGNTTASTTTITTTTNKEIYMFPQEINELLHHRPISLIQLLYKQKYLYDNSDFSSNNKNIIQKKLQGYKSPNEITQYYVLDTYYRTYFPTTKLIIGIRHPILYFQSLYNFRLQNIMGTSSSNTTSLLLLLQNNTTTKKLLNTNNLIGPCSANILLPNVCTSKANFAYYLLRLGKHLSVNTTNATSSMNTKSSIQLLEKQIVNHYKKLQYDISAIVPIPNKIFLYEINQLNVNNNNKNNNNNQPLRQQQQLQQQFQYDLQQYLDLQYPLDDVSTISKETTGSTEKVRHLQGNKQYQQQNQHYSKPGIIYTNKTIQSIIDSYKINICDDQHIIVRRELLVLSQLSSKWIRYVLLQQSNSNNNVIISSPKYFDSLLQNWMYDPCGNTTKTETIQLNNKNGIKFKI